MPYFERVTKSLAGVVHVLCEHRYHGTIFHEQRYMFRGSDLNRGAVTNELTGIEVVPVTTR